MATIGGARACHIGQITGSLEVGKRADLIVVNLYTLHNTPAFYLRDPNAIYTQLVYAGKAADVRDTMVNGKFLMRDRALLTVDEAKIRAESNAMARRISDFLAEREGDVLRKLAAISGVQQEKSFEVQVKARVSDIQPLIDIINNDKEITVVRHVHYKQYDTYFYFAEEKSRLRYREDMRVDANSNVTTSRYRLTLVGGQTEREFPHSIVLSRVRFMAPADRSLRFYREYFKPAREMQVEKDRLRWEVIFEDDELFVNLDRVLSPARDGYFVEIKSRTWSVRDAERKAAVIGKLLARFGIGDELLLRQEYVDIVAQ